MTSLQSKRKDELLLICKEKNISAFIKREKRKLLNSSMRSILPKQKTKPTIYKITTDVIYSPPMTFPN